MELAWTYSTLRRSDDGIVKQARQWTPQGHGIHVEGDHRTRGKEIWTKKCGQQVSSTAGGRWRRQHRMKTSSLWSMLLWERKGLSQVSQADKQ